MIEHLANTAANGDRLATLELLRDRLAQEIDECFNQQHLPALVLRFQAVLAEIDQMPQSRASSKADEIAARRAARRGSDPAHQAHTAPRSG